MQIALIGTIIGSTGYDIHTRNLANALNKIIPVRLITGIPPGMNLNLTDSELGMLKRPQIKDEVNLIITHPMHWKLNLGKRNFVYLIWEGDSVPKHIANECANPEIEKIIVPSNHVKDALIKSADTIQFADIFDKVVVVPHGINPELFKPEVKPKKCVFLANKGFRNLEDRGGIQYLIKAYLEEFTNKDPVELIIKINPAYGIINFQEVLKDSFFPQKTNSAPIHIDVGLYDYEKLPQLYNKATVFVSPTRAEAFNIPCLEAMGCGLPVITTNFGGQTDYVNDKNGWIVGGELTEIKHELQYEGTKWLTPDISELRNALRQALNKPDEVFSKGMRANLDAQSYTWDKSARLIRELI
jgi:glycosyltransferase involved in cell wall biosynthesis